MQETQGIPVQSRDGEDLLEEDMASHSSILAWRIPKDRGAWRGYSLWGRAESDRTGRARRQAGPTSKVATGCDLGKLCWQTGTGSSPRSLRPQLSRGVVAMTRACVHVKSLPSSPTLCGTMDCSPPGSSVHGILQAKILERVAMPSSRGSSWPRNCTHIPYVSCVGRQVLYH